MSSNSHVDQGSVTPGEPTTAAAASLQTSVSASASGSGSGSGSVSKESVGKLFKGLFSAHKDRDRDKLDKGFLKPRTTIAGPNESPTGSLGGGASASPANTTAASPSTSPSWPFSSEKEGTIRKEKEKGEKTTTTTTTTRSTTSASAKVKFMDFFRSDAEKRGNEKAGLGEKEKSSTKVPGDSTSEPVKLELKSNLTEAGRPPITGEPIQAEGFTLRPNGMQESLALIGSAGVCRWFRASDDGFDQICECREAIYVPTVDDVNCRICCQWVMEEAVHDGRTRTGTGAPNQQSSFAEIGPILLDPTIAQASLDLFSGGKAVFTVREQETEEVCQITVKRTMIRILPADGGAVKCSFMLVHKSAPSTVALPVKFHLDASDPRRFSIEDTHSHKVFRGSILVDVDDSAQLIRARRDRDAMACLIRRIIRTGSEAINNTNKQMNKQERTINTNIDAMDASHTVPSSSHATAPNHVSIPVGLDFASPGATPSDFIQVHLSPILSSNCEMLVQVDLVPILVSSTASLDEPQPAIDPIDHDDAVNADFRMRTPESNATEVGSHHPHSTVSPNVPSSSSLFVSLSSPSPLPPLVSSSASPSSSTVSVTSQSPTQILALTKRIAELTAEKNLFRENLHLLMAEKSQSDASMQSTIGTQSNEIASLNQQLDQRGEDVDALKLAIQTLSDQMSTLANTEIRLSKEIRQLKDERDHLQRALQEEQRSHTSKLGAKDDLYTKLQAEKSSYLDQLAQLTGELQSARAESQRLAPLEDRCARFTEIEANLRHDIGVYRLEIQRLKEVQTKLEQVEIENHQLRKEKEKEKERRRLEGDVVDVNSGMNGPISDSHRVGSVVNESTPVLCAHDQSLTSSIGGLASFAHPLELVPSDQSSIAVQSVDSDTATPMPSHRHHRMHGPTDTTNETNAGTGDLTAVKVLQDQLTLVQSDHQQLVTLHDKAQAHIRSLETELSKCESAYSDARGALESASSQYEALRVAHDEVVANRNYYKRKCESLSASVDQLLKAANGQHQTNNNPTPTHATTPIPTEISATTTVATTNVHPAMQSSSTLLAWPEKGPKPKSTTQQQPQEQDRDCLDRAPSDPSASELRRLRATIQDLRQENHDLHQTIQAFKKTLEHNYQLLKYERDANLLLTSKGSHLGAGGLFARNTKQTQLLHQFESVRALANSLSELITEKDLSIDHLKKSNFILGKRIFELETRFQKELEEAGDTAMGRTFNGRIDLEQEESKYQASRAASATTSQTNSQANSQANTPTAAELTSSGRFHHPPASNGDPAGAPSNAPSD